MRSRARLILAVLAAIAAVFALAGIGFLYATLAGVSVSVRAASVTIHNNGLPIHSASISVLDGSRTIRIPISDIPRGVTTVTLPNPVGSYEGFAVSGLRLGMAFSAYSSEQARTPAHTQQINPPALSGTGPHGANPREAVVTEPR